jgi:hypothetical protein
MGASSETEAQAGAMKLAGYALVTGASRGIGNVSHKRWRNGRGIDP